MYKFAIHNTKQVFTFSTSRKFANFINTIFNELEHVPNSDNLFLFHGLLVSILANDDFLIDLFM